MKKRCLSLLLTLCLLAALAVPAFAQEAEKQPTLQPASEHPSVLLNTPAVEIPAVRAEIEPMCVPHASMRSLSIARGYEGYLYYSLYRGTYSGTYGYSIEVYRGTSITEANYVGGYADGYTSAEPQLLELSLDSALTSTLSAGTYTVVSTVLVAVNGEARPVSGTETKTQIQVVNDPIPLQGVYMESVKNTMYLDPGQEITTRVAFSPANTTARRNYELSFSDGSVFSALDFGNDITVRAEQPGSTTFYVLLGGYMGGFRLIVRGYTASMAQKEQTLHEGSSAKLSFTVSPDDGQTKAVWSSNDPQIVSVAQDGIVNGVGNNKFDPDAKITREQLAAVLYRYAGKVGMDVTARADLKLFPDADSVSAYATDALSWCVANGIVNGTLEHGTAYLDPQGSATRAQVATLMSRYLKLTEA